MALKKLFVAVDFEVFGLVQGVSFRVYTQRQAKKLELVGWVRNTERETVVGTMQGEQVKVDEMKHWLSTTGSPTSKIDKAVFVNERPIEEFSFCDFIVKK